MSQIEWTWMMWTWWTAIGQLETMRATLRGRRSKRLISIVCGEENEMERTRQTQAGRSEQLSKFDAKFVEIDSSVSIEIGFAHQLIEMWLAQRLAQHVHGGPQFVATDESVAISIEHLKCCPQIALHVVVSVFHLPESRQQDSLELVLVDQTVACFSTHTRGSNGRTKAKTKISRL